MIRHLPGSRILAILCLVAACASALGQEPAAPADPGLPYVYTQWKHFTAADGLPNEHIFAVKADGPRVWIGTEGGLACLDKASGKIRTWGEKEGLPWKVVSGIALDPKTGDVWLGLFGGGLARYSAGRFDHWNQFNSGLVNDVVYGVSLEGDHVWVATTAGCSRFNPVSGQWTIYNEKNAPMEEIWNYGVSCAPEAGKVFLAVWGSGVLEFDIAAEHWKHYLDPDGEMEIDLFRDDGVIHVITTGVSYKEDVLWVSSYFGLSRYDGRHWRGYYAHETGMTSDFTNNLAGRSAQECWFATDKGLSVITDFESDTWVSYTRDPQSDRGIARVFRGGTLVKTVDMERAVPHNFIVSADIDGNDAWVGTSKGLGWAVGEGYYPRLRVEAP